MHSFSSLQTVLPGLSPIPVHQALYRGTNLAYIHGVPAPDFLYSFGTGHRYTPLNHPMRTLYVAEDDHTAYIEASRVHEVANISAVPIITIALINARLDRVLNLCDVAVQQALGTDEAELKAPFRLAQKQGRLVPTQELSRAVYESGLFQAIRYPSAQPGGNACLVAYYERIIDPCFLELIDPSGKFIGRIPP